MLANAHVWEQMLLLVREFKKQGIHAIHSPPLLIPLFFPSGLRGKSVLLFLQGLFLPFVVFIPLSITSSGKFLNKCFSLRILTCILPPPAFSSQIKHKYVQVSWIYIHTSPSLRTLFPFFLFFLQKCLTKWYVLPLLLPHLPLIHHPWLLLSSLLNPSQECHK